MRYFREVLYCLFLFEQQNSKSLCKAESDNMNSKQMMFILHHTVASGENNMNKSTVEKIAGWCCKRGRVYREVFDVKRGGC